MEKVKISQEQAKGIEKIKENSVAFNIKKHKEYGWKQYRSLNELTMEELAIALFVGYEVEPEFKEGDCVVYEGMYPKLIGKIVIVDGELRVDTPRYKVPQSLPVSELRHATKQDIWWFENDRDFWEIREDDTLKYIGDLYIVDWFDSENVGFKSINENAGKFVETLDYVKEHFTVFCFAEDRKDI